MTLCMAHVALHLPSGDSRDAATDSLFASAQRRRSQHVCLARDVVLPQLVKVLGGPTQATQGRAHDGSLRVSEGMEMRTAWQTVETKER